MKLYIGVNCKCCSDPTDVANAVPYAYSLTSGKNALVTIALGRADTNVLMKVR